MARGKKKKTASLKQNIEMLPPPRSPGGSKYQWWAFVIWVVGVILILLKWGNF